MDPPVGERVFRFTATFYDHHSELVKTYYLAFYEVDNTVHVTDPATKSVFLKRCEPPEGVTLAQLFVGANVTLFSRKFNIVDYADEYTRRVLSPEREKSAGIITGSALGKLGKVLAGVYDAGLEIARMKSVELSGKEAEAFLTLGRAGARALPSQVSALTGRVVALEVVGSAAVATWKTLAGAFPGEVLGSASASSAAGECEFLFSAERRSTAVHRDCAVAILKPHVVADRTYCRILQQILDAGFAVSAVSYLTFSRPDAADYFEVYKGIVGEYEGWVTHVSSGASIALEIVGEDIVNQLREYVGPYIPEIARTLRPESIRAVHGLDPVRNAIHVTDLSTDGPLESKFIFHVLQQE